MTGRQIRPEWPIAAMYNHGGFPALILQYRVKAMGLVRIKQRAKAFAGQHLYKTQIFINNLIARNFKKEHRYNGASELLAVTVAFNNPALIRMQHESLVSYSGIGLDYFVYDNSSDRSSSRMIEKYCIEHKIDYYRPMAKAIRENPSFDHGAALNCCIKRISTLKHAYKYLLLLDHDIFLSHFWSPSCMIKEGSSLAAPIQKRGGHIYYWPGLMLISLDSVQLSHLCFLPDIKLGLDTGGRLGKLILETNISVDVVEHDGYLNIENDDFIEPNGDYFNQLLMANLIVEKYGPWIHLINGSGWRGRDNHKRALDFVLAKINQIE